MMDDLKPCPFCGSDPMPEFYSSEGGTGYAIHCQAEACPAWPSTHGENEDEAITAWNARAPDPRLAEVEADLEARGYQWMGESLSRPPRGYDKEHPHVEDLKRKSFAVKRIFSDAAVCEADFLDQFADACADAAPLSAFVCAALDLPF